MKKTYITPNVKIVEVLPITFCAGSKTEEYQYMINSSSRESENRFEDTDEDWDWEDNSK